MCHKDAAADEAIPKPYLEYSRHEKGVPRLQDIVIR